MRYHLTPKSSNAKTGPIPVSTSSAVTCPDTCPLKRNGCYADGGPLALHWRKVTRGERGDDWHTFTRRIAALPDGQLWRHNQAGDLPGVGDAIDKPAMLELIGANIGRRGFTYTHKPIASEVNRDLIRYANQRGFTVNLSANSLQDADELADAGVAPVVVILPSEQRTNTATPKGRKVVVCPAETRDDVTCESCQMCARQRDTIIGFPAHGSGARKAEAVAITFHRA